MNINKLPFEPLLGLGSPHLQMILSALFPVGKAPPSQRWLVDLDEGDSLACEVSTPPNWKEEGRTIVLIHGMGGCHSSSYMVRMAQKFYARGDRVVRVNLRGCGSGQGLSKLPYHAGTSGDVLKVVQALKREVPSSELFVIGFSLGGNIVLKLAGELGKEAGKLVKTFIAICAPLDLAQSLERIQETRHFLYSFYYLQKIRQQGRAWNAQNIRTLYEVDDLITAPLWGYKGASDYYRDCSSLRFLPRIQQSTHILFAEDDPFISLDQLRGLSLPPAVQIWTTERGGHMGFLGRVSQELSLYWMDFLLLQWVE